MEIFEILGIILSIIAAIAILTLASLGFGCISDHNIHYIDACSKYNTYENCQKQYLTKKQKHSMIELSN